MEFEQAQNQTCTRRQRRLAVVGLICVVAMAALAGIGRLAQAQPMASSAVAVPPPVSPNATRLQSHFDIMETFEGASVLDFWELTGTPGPPGWNLLATGSPWLTYTSASHAMWFGDPAEGDFGGVGCDDCPIYSGMLTYIGPSVPIPDTDLLAYMTFWSRERTEMSIPTLECYQMPTCPFDSRQVWIFGTLNPGWVLKWDTRINPTIENQWHNVAIDISEYRGQSIRMRFVFDTIDGRNNDAAGSKPAGWHVDDVRLYTFTPASFIRLPAILKNKSP